jgi:hypothetical protein
LLLPEWASTNIAPFVHDFPPIIFLIQRRPETSGIQGHSMGQQARRKPAKTIFWRGMALSGIVPR